MIVIGLTGGIGMGKSAVAGILRALGMPVYNADRAVHALLGKRGKAVKPVAKLFPASASNAAQSTANNWAAWFLAIRPN